MCSYLSFVRQMYMLLEYDSNTIQNIFFSRNLSYKMAWHGSLQNISSRPNKIPYAPKLPPQALHHVVRIQGPTQPKQKRL